MKVLENKYTDEYEIHISSFELIEALSLLKKKNIQRNLTEPKYGYWIDKGWNGDWQFRTDGRGNSWHEWECSECGFITKGAKWNFCPNCGAKMDGKEDNNG